MITLGGIQKETPEVVSSICKFPAPHSPAWVPQRWSCLLHTGDIFPVLTDFPSRSFLNLTMYSSFLVLSCYSLTACCKNGVCTSEFFASSGSGHTWQLPVCREKKLFPLIEFMQKWSRMGYKGKYLNCDSTHSTALVILCGFKMFL